MWLLQVSPTAMVLTFLFAAGGLIAWRKDYPQAAAILIGFAVLTLIRVVLHQAYSA